MNRLAFLCGVPGAGKSTIRKSLRGEKIQCVELGFLFRDIHKTLFPNKKFNDAKWVKYFKKNVRDESIQNLFCKSMESADLDLEKSPGLLIVGNKFRVKEIEDFVFDVLVTQGSFDPPLKLFLDVDAKIVYERRILRRNKSVARHGRASRFDRKISRRRVNRRVSKYRKKLPPRGWIPIADGDATGALKDYYESEHLS